MFFLKTLSGQVLVVDSATGMTTPQQILNFFVERSGLGVDNFKIIVMGQRVAGADLHKTCGELGWAKLGTIHLVLTPAAKAFIAEQEIHRIQFEAADAGCGAGCSSRA